MWSVVSDIWKQELNEMTDDRVLQWSLYRRYISAVFGNKKASYPIRGAPPSKTYRVGAVDTPMSLGINGKIALDWRKNGMLSTLAVIPAPRLGDRDRPKARKKVA